MWECLFSGTQIYIKVCKPNPEAKRKTKNTEKKQPTLTVFLNHFFSLEFCDNQW